MSFNCHNNKCALNDAQFPSVLAAGPQTNVSLNRDLSMILCLHF